MWNWELKLDDLEKWNLINNKKLLIEGRFIVFLNGDILELIGSEDGASYLDIVIDAKWMNLVSRLVDIIEENDSDTRDEDILIRLRDELDDIVFDEDDEFKEVKWLYDDTEDQDLGITMKNNFVELSNKCFEFLYLIYSGLPKEPTKDDFKNIINELVK
jgi:hypothetical protein